MLAFNYGNAYNLTNPFGYPHTFINQGKTGEE